jgi:hypothetical protein
MIRESTAVGAHGCMVLEHPIELRKEHTVRVLIDSEMDAGSLGVQSSKTVCWAWSEFV